MKYLINTISNRDYALLYHYRILRQSSDFLSPIFTDDNPAYLTIFHATPSQLLYQEQPLYEYSLDIDIKENAIPYLEFLVRSDSDYETLSDLVYLDTETKILYSLSNRLHEPVDIQISWVPSLSDLEQMLRDYSAALEQLKVNLDKITDTAYSQDPNATYHVSGTPGSLLQIKQTATDTEAVDSRYRIVPGLHEKLLINPTQELLEIIPKVLKGTLSIRITDNANRILEGFQSHAIRITGNGSWVFRDVKSSLLVGQGSSTRKIQAFNCSRILITRIGDADLAAGQTTLDSFIISNSLAIGNTGTLQVLKLLNKSVFVNIGMKINLLDYVGPGSLYAANFSVPVFNLERVLGEVILERCTKDNKSHRQLIYRNGKRLGFNYNQHDFEIPPSDIVAFDLDYIHVRGGNA